MHIVQVIYLQSTECVEFLTRMLKCIKKDRLKSISLLFTTALIAFYYPLIIFGQQWELQESGTTRDLLGVYFIDTARGWACGDSGVVISTSDGGATWVLQQSGTEINLNDITFVNSLLGWTVGDSGTILKTVDGGETWEFASFEGRNTLLRVQFTSAEYGFAVGDSSTLIMSSDSGASWERLGPIGPATITTFWFMNDFTGIIAVFTDPLTRPFITLDRGRTWNPHVSLGRVRLRDASGRQNETWVVFVGDSGRTFMNPRFTAELSVWYLSFVPGASQLNGISVDSVSDTLWVVGDSGIVAISADTGLSWERIPQELTLVDLNAVSFPKSDIGWAVGDNGTILKRVTVTGIKSNFDDVYSNSFQVHQNWPNPFNANTMIAYFLPKADHTKLIVYDLRGHEIAELIDGYVESGDHSVTWDAVGYPSGVYIYRLSSGNFTKTRKMVLLK